jgi:hypothetical protein
MQLLQTLTSFKYCNKKIKKKIYTFHQMMKGVGIIKFKFFYTIFFFCIWSNVCKFKNNLTHHFSIEIPNLYWEGSHHLNCKQPPLPTLSHMDCLIHQFLVLMEQHFILQLSIMMKQHFVSKLPNHHQLFLVFFF